MSDEFVSADVFLQQLEQQAAPPAEPLRHQRAAAPLRCQLERPAGPPQKRAPAAVLGQRNTVKPDAAAKWAHKGGAGRVGTVAPLPAAQPPTFSRPGMQKPALRPKLAQQAAERRPAGAAGTIPAVRGPYPVRPAVPSPATKQLLAEKRDASRFPSVVFTSRPQQAPSAPLPGTVAALPSVVPAPTTALASTASGAAAAEDEDKFDDAHSLPSAEGSGVGAWHDAHGVQLVIQDDDAASVASEAETVVLCRGPAPAASSPSSSVPAPIPSHSPVAAEEQEVSSFRHAAASLASDVFHSAASQLAAVDVSASLAGLPAVPEKELAAPAGEEPAAQGSPPRGAAESASGPSVPGPEVGPPPEPQQGSGSAGEVLLIAEGRDPAWQEGSSLGWPAEDEARRRCFSAVSERSQSTAAAPSLACELSERSLQYSLDDTTHRSPQPSSDAALGAEAEGALLPAGACAWMPPRPQQPAALAAVAASPPAAPANTPVPAVMAGHAAGGALQHAVGVDPVAVALAITAAAGDVQDVEQHNSPPLSAAARLGPCPDAASPVGTAAPASPVLTEYDGDDVVMRDAEFTPAPASVRRMPPGSSRFRLEALASAGRALARPAPSPAASQSWSGVSASLELFAAGPAEVQPGPGKQTLVVTLAAASNPRSTEHAAVPGSGMQDLPGPEQAAPAAGYPPEPQQQVSSMPAAPTDAVAGVEQDPMPSMPEPLAAVAEMQAAQVPASEPAPGLEEVTRPGLPQDQQQPMELGCAAAAAMAEQLEGALGQQEGTPAAVEPSSEWRASLPDSAEVGSVGAAHVAAVHAALAFAAPPMLTMSPSQSAVTAAVPATVTPPAPATEPSPAAAATAVPTPATLATPAPPAMPLAAATAQSPAAAPTPAAVAAPEPAAMPAPAPDALASPVLAPVAEAATPPAPAPAAMLAPPPVEDGEALAFAARPRLSLTPVAGTHGRSAGHMGPEPTQMEPAQLAPASTPTQVATGIAAESVGEGEPSQPTVHDVAAPAGPDLAAPAPGPEQLRAASHRSAATLAQQPAPGAAEAAFLEAHKAPAVLVGPQSEPAGQATSAAGSTGTPLAAARPAASTASSRRASAVSDPLSLSTLPDSPTMSINPLASAVTPAPSHATHSVSAAAQSTCSSGTLSNNPLYAGTPGYPTPPSVTLKPFPSRQGQAGGSTGAPTPSGASSASTPASTGIKLAERLQEVARELQQPAAPQGLAAALAAVTPAPGVLSGQTPLSTRFDFAADVQRLMRALEAGTPATGLQQLPALGRAAALATTARRAAQQQLPVARLSLSSADNTVLDLSSFDADGNRQTASTPLLQQQLFAAAATPTGLPSRSPAGRLILRTQHAAGGAGGASSPTVGEAPAPAMPPAPGEVLRLRQEAAQLQHHVEALQAQRVEGLALLVHYQGSIRELQDRHSEEVVRLQAEADVLRAQVEQEKAAREKVDRRFSSLYHDKYLPLKQHAASLGGDLAAQQHRTAAAEAKAHAAAEEAAAAREELAAGEAATAGAQATERQLRAELVAAREAEQRLQARLAAEVRRGEKAAAASQAELADFKAKYEALTRQYDDSVHRLNMARQAKERAMLDAQRKDEEACALQVQLQQLEAVLKDYKRENGKFFEVKERLKGAIAGLQRELADKQAENEKLVALCSELVAKMEREGLVLDG